MKNLDEKKTFAVEAKCGHVGRKYYIAITFPVVADNGKEAAKIVRRIPRVKHDHKDAIISVKEITIEEYEELIQQNKNDEYLQCHSVQEQRLRCDGLNERIIRENNYTRGDNYCLEEERKFEREERIAFKKKKYLSFLVGDRYCSEAAFI